KARARCELQRHWIRVDREQDSAADRLTPIVGFQLGAVLPYQLVEAHAPQLEQGRRARLSDALRQSGYRVESRPDRLVRLRRRKQVLNDWPNHRYVANGCR